MLKKFVVITKSQVVGVYAEKFEITPSGVALFKNFKDENIEAFTEYHQVIFIDSAE